MITVIVEFKTYLLLHIDATIHEKRRHTPPRKTNAPLIQVMKLQMVGMVEPADTKGKSGTTQPYGVNSLRIAQSVLIINCPPVASAPQLSLNDRSE